MKNQSPSLPVSMLIGIGIGIPITMVLMTLIGGFNEVIREFLIWTVSSALYGLFSNLFFSKFEKLILPAAMALHCIACLIVTSIAAMLCGYANSFLAALTCVLPAFVIVYILVCIFCFALMKMEEKAVNRALNKE